MPVRRDRTEDIEPQLSRLTYGKGRELKRHVHNYLYTHPNHAFCAEELSARIRPAAAPVQIESVLSHHPEEYEYYKRNGKLYWTLKSDNPKPKETFY